jgi:hypothetical protein
MRIGSFLNFFFEKLDKFFHRTCIQILESYGKLGFLDSSRWLGRQKCYLGLNLGEQL